ncbi:MAG: nitrous oxide reductase accessory protein NosL [Deltaproteobacteria bacterium]|nr:nitrous oxide reductase accessory protein NosL [Deltaproteobacteria bacterium]
MDIHRRNCIKILVVSGTGLLIVPDIWALELHRRNRKTERQPYITVTKKDRCPVCGMFVHPYQKWITQIQFKDGSHHSFDGMKCMCRFFINPGKYDSTKKKQDIKLVLVRDFYTLKFIRHDTAFYVVGSDVFGPMGHELIPFDSKKNAGTFLADHNGLKIFRFHEINSELLDKLDKAKKTVVLD